MSHLAFSGAIVFATALGAIEHLAAYSLIAGKTTFLIAAETDLLDGLHFFVFVIKAIT